MNFLFRSLWLIVSLVLPAVALADEEQDQSRDQDSLVLEGLSRSLEDNPADAKVRLKRAMYFLWRTFDYERALEDFNRVLEQEPDNVTAYVGRADVYTGWDARFYDPRKADADARKALELDPQSSEAHRILGDIPGHPGMGKPAESRRRYEEALALDPDNLLARIGLAYTYAKEDTDFHDRQKALHHATKALEIAPNETLALETLGDLLSSEVATRREGLQLLNRAVSLNPRNMGTFLARGYTNLLWSMEEEWAQLIEELQKEELGLIDSIRGNDRAFQDALGRLGNRSRMARALRDFDRAEALCPHSHDVFSAKAYALQNFPGQERRALDCYTRAVELNPHDASSLIERSEFLISNPQLMIDPDQLPEDGGELDGAMLGELIAEQFPAVSRELDRALSKALKIDPDAKGFFLRGSLRGSALEDYRGAIEDLSAAIDLEPLDPSYYEARASIHEAFGHDEEAQRDRERINDLENLD